MQSPPSAFLTAVYNQSHEDPEPCPTAESPVTNVDNPALELYPAGRVPLTHRLDAIRRMMEGTLTFSGPEKGWTGSGKGEKNIGTFIVVTRCRAKSGRLTAERIRKLTAAGFCWESPTRPASTNGIKAALTKTTSPPDVTDEECTCAAEGAEGAEQRVSRWVGSRSRNPPRKDFASNPPRKSKKTFSTHQRLFEP